MSDRLLNLHKYSPQSNTANAEVSDNLVAKFLLITNTPEYFSRRDNIEKEDTAEI